MDDPAIVCTHLPQGNRLADPFGFFGQTKGKFFQVGFSGFKVSGDIHLNPNPIAVAGVVVFIDDFWMLRKQSERVGSFRF